MVNVVWAIFGTGGAQFDDPDFSKYNDEIDNWVRGVCP